MPSIELVEQFVNSVEENKHDETIEAFYAIDASMQDNNSSPRIGRELLIQNEKQILKKAKSISSKCIHPVFINGENVVIRWIFQFVWLNGTKTVIEELAYQKWENNKIKEEKFFYDPKQMNPK
jgi:hypothetical protein